MAQSPTLVPIYYEASGGVYETRFPTKFGRPAFTGLILPMCRVKMSTAKLLLGNTTIPT